MTINAKQTTPENGAETSRVLIWGKTYPELSNNYRETVCTGGCLEDGSPIRLYPVPLRYIRLDKQYRLYDWVQVPLQTNPRDPRPESYRIAAQEFEITGHVGTANAWEARKAVIFRNQDWHYPCLERLKERQEKDGSSLGFVRVGEVDKIEPLERDDEQRKKHNEKLERLKSQTDLFGEKIKDLEFCGWRVRLIWHCQGISSGSSCPGHSAQILDWGLSELIRREGIESGLKKVEEISNLDLKELGLFMGNFRQHLGSFGIVGLWYPPKRSVTQVSLFD